MTTLWLTCAVLNMAVGNVLLGCLCAVNAGINPLLNAVFGDPDGGD